MSWGAWLMSLNERLVSWPRVYISSVCIYMVCVGCCAFRAIDARLICWTILHNIYSYRLSLLLCSNRTAQLTVHTLRTIRHMECTFRIYCELTVRKVFMNRVLIYIASFVCGMCVDFASNHFVVVAQSTKQKMLGSRALPWALSVIRRRRRLVDYANITFIFAHISHRYINGVNTQTVAASIHLSRGYMCKHTSTH